MNYQPVSNRKPDYEERISKFNLKPRELEALPIVKQSIFDSAIG